MRANRVIICIVFLFAAAFLPICGCKTNVSQTDAGGEISGNLEAQAMRIIQQGLTDGNPQVRASAIEIAAATKRGEFVPAIRRLLADEFVPVRFAAAVAIGDVRYTAARNDVAQLLKDGDENVRIAASYAISRMDAVVSSKQLQAAIKSNDQRVRANAAFLLGKTGDKGALPLLYEALNDEASDDRVRLNSVEAIAWLGDERIYQKLWAMLISAYADDRVFGVEAMGALGTVQGRDAILTMLKDDLAEVRLVAAEQLGRLGDRAGESVVLAALERDAAAATDAEGRARIQTLAASAIGQIQTSALKKFLPELLKNDSRIVRLAAAKAVLQGSGRDNIGR